jgi:serine/threonine protein kinase
VITWACDLTNALDHLHSHKIKHRNVRAENVYVFEQFRLKLGNFGFPNEKHNMDTTNDDLVAPEVFLSHGYFFASDIFSFAVTFYRMFLREAFSISKSVYHMICAVVDSMKRDSNNASNTSVHQAVENLLDRCTKMNFQNRISSVELSMEINRILCCLGGDERSKLSKSSFDFIGTDAERSSVSSNSKPALLTSGSSLISCDSLFNNTSPLKIKLQKVSSRSDQVFNIPFRFPFTATDTSEIVDKRNKLLFAPKKSNSVSGVIVILT